MYAAYLRKSRADDPNDTVEEVLAKHRRDLEALAQHNNIVISDFFEEVASGESLSQRPEMLKLLKSVQTGLYTAVLCVDIDRLGRGGMADQGIILDAFRYSETLIITPDKTYDLSDELDEEMTEFKAFMARREYKMIRKRMQRGRMRTVENGGYIANPPYGYKSARVNKTPTLEIVPEEAEFIKYIFNRYLSGVGASTISEELNAMGSVPRRCDHWSRSTVRSILKNPTFAGKVAWNRVKHYRPGSHGKDRHHVVYMPEEKWLFADGIHPPIISWEDWTAAQDLRVSRHIPSKKTGHTQNPFAGLILCSRCGHKMQRMGENNGVPYILCTKKDCQASAKEEYVEEHLIGALHDILEKIKLSDQSTVLPEEYAIHRDMLAALDKDIVKVQARAPKLYELLEDGVYDRATFAARMAAQESELSKLAAQRKKIEAELNSMKLRDMKKTGERLENVLKLYPTLDAEGKNILLKTIVEKVVYTKHKKTKPRDFTLEITLHHIF